MNKRWISVLLAVMMLLSLGLGAAPVKAAAPAPALTDPGEETQLQATTLPEGSAHDKITWESMDPEIATVDENGVVRAVSEGSTMIIANAEHPDGSFPTMGSCPVMVFDFQPVGYEIVFDPMGGTCPVPSLFTVEAEGLPDTLLSYPPAEREGFTFLGWFLEPEGGEPLEPLYPFTGDTTLYAHWAEDVRPPDPGECGGSDDCPSIAFTDVNRAPGSWYHAPVDWAVVNGITNGTDETHFSPGGICTRAEAVTFLYRAAGSPEVGETENPFTDVKEGSFYDDAVRWAVEQGVTKGVSEHAFAPNDPCTRAEIVTFLFRAKRAEAVQDAENPFTDVPENAWYTDSVLWAVREGVTNGDGAADIFHPGQTCTRAMIVTFLYRAK